VREMPLGEQALRLLGDAAARRHHLRKRQVDERHARSDLGARAHRGELGTVVAERVVRGVPVGKRLRGFLRGPPHVRRVDRDGHPRALRQDVSEERRRVARTLDEDRGRPDHADHPRDAPRARGLWWRTGRQTTRAPQIEPVGERRRRGCGRRERGRRRGDRPPSPEVASCLEEVFPESRAPSARLHHDVEVLPELLDVVLRVLQHRARRCRPRSSGVTLRSP